MAFDPVALDFDPELLSSNLSILVAYSGGSTTCKRAETAELAKVTKEGRNFESGLG